MASRLGLPTTDADRFPDANYGTSTTLAGSSNSSTVSFPRSFSRTDCRRAPGAGRGRSSPRTRHRIGARLSLNYGVRYNRKLAPYSLTSTQPLLVDFEALQILKTLPTGSRLWDTSWSLAPRIAAGYQLSGTSGRGDHAPRRMGGDV